MFVILALIAMAVAMVCLLVYACRYSRTNESHLRSFTPTCPNCESEIRATDSNEAKAKDRLRDHFKECI